MKKITHTLVIGGGFAGAIAAQELAKANVNVMLVDRKDYFEVTFAALRNLADFDTLKSTPRVKYKDFIRGVFVQAGVSELTTSQAILDNGESIQFEQAIIATGSSYSSFPIAKSTDALTFDARHQELKEAAAELASSKSVLIIGAGAVGVELAGEIAYKYPHINVTLAEASNSVLPIFNKKTQKKSTEQLKALGVNIETNRLYQFKDGIYVDSNTGDTLDVDIAYVAVGIRPNSSFMQAQLADKLSDRGFIKVNNFYKVEGTDNLYAIGDVADLPDVKLAAAAIPQAKKLVTNLIAAQAGKSVKAHKPTPVVGMIPIGQKKGVAQLPFGTFTWKFLIDLKNKDLFISNIKKEIGAA